MDNIFSNQTKLNQQLKNKKNITNFSLHNFFNSNKVVCANYNFFGLQFTILCFTKLQQNKSNQKAHTSNNCNYFLINQKNANTQEKQLLLHMLKYLVNTTQQKLLLEKTKKQTKSNITKTKQKKIQYQPEVVIIIQFLLHILKSGQIYRMDLFMFNKKIYSNIQICILNKQPNYFQTRNFLTSQKRLKKCFHLLKNLVISL
eukprot:TRINITY_DN20152_c0_g1_i8.p3 TRINITY_DN20152_c0_g1~~TRINITY_DN20152_c0_g1_i8.p3  ORF type:complete len:201 (+),score=-7.70 TRINITY_DN20152_c0_g1_i8:340-942(+)